MLFSHDVDLCLRVAVALVNTAEPRHAGMDSIADRDRFAADFECTGRFDRDDAEVAALRRIRPELRELLLADRDEAVERLNDILHRCRALPQLVRHEGVDWHIHATSADRPFHERVLVETAMAMVDVVRADEHSRLGVCADETCDALVLDLSRNRSRRFCSAACGNRNAVAAYRARRSADG